MVRAESSENFPFMLAERVKEEPLGCGSCGQAGGFDLFDTEVGGMPLGWVVVFTYRQASAPDEEGGVVAINWTPYCPACAPAPDPRELHRFGIDGERGRER